MTYENVCDRLAQTNRCYNMKSLEINQLSMVVEAKKYNFLSATFFQVRVTFVYYVFSSLL